MGLGFRVSVLVIWGFAGMGGLVRLGFRVSVWVMGGYQVGCPWCVGDASWIPGWLYRVPPGDSLTWLSSAWLGSGLCSLRISKGGPVCF